jgi:hypothetical protein
VRIMRYAIQTGRSHNVRSDDLGARSPRW